MKLLEAEPIHAPVPAEAQHSPAGAAGEAPSPAPAAEPASGRACAACGAAMEAEQDWCLGCGTAAPGRLGRRPGWRAAATIAALTLTLVAGSVAAAYAALTTDATHEAAAPPPAAAGPVAQAPPATPPSTATPPAPKSGLPTVKAPRSPSGTPGGTVMPVSPPATSHHAPAPPAQPATPRHHGPTGTDDHTGGGQQHGGKTPPPPPAPGPDSQRPVAIELPGDAGSVYDPGQQADTPGDPSLAIDGDPTTAFDVGALSDAWGLGYAIDLQDRRGVRQVRIQTDTPGFQVEVYATAAKTPPATIDDAAWTKLHDAVAVGVKRPRTTIKLGDGATKYRHLVIWLTAGPDQGGRVSLGEVTVLG